MDIILQFTRPVVHPLPKINRAKCQKETGHQMTLSQLRLTHKMPSTSRVTSTSHSLTEAPGNPGPCEAAAIILNNDRDSHELHQPVARRGSSYLVELKGVELVLFHFLSLDTQKQIYIFCDCLSVIESVASCRIQNTYQATVDSIQSLIRRHSLNQIMV